MCLGHFSKETEEALATAPTDCSSRVFVGSTSAIVTKCSISSTFQLLSSPHEVLCLHPPSSSTPPLTKCTSSIPPLDWLCNPHEVLCLHPTSSPPEESKDWEDPTSSLAQRLQSSRSALPPSPSPSEESRDWEAEPEP